MTRYVSMHGSDRLTVVEFDALSAVILAEGEAAADARADDPDESEYEHRKAADALRKLYRAAVRAGWGA